MGSTHNGKKKSKEDTEIAEYSRRHSLKRKFNKKPPRNYSSKEINNNISENSLQTNLNDGKIKQNSLTTSKLYQSPEQISDLKQLKCLSYQNLVKIQKPNSMEDITTSSKDKNFNSNNTNYDDNFLINENKERFLTEEDEDIGNETEIKDEDLIRTEEPIKSKSKTLDIEEKEIFKGLKTVFIETRNSCRDTSATSLSIDSRYSSISTNNYDFELNFYRNGEDIRRSYIAKLISSRIWTPNQKPKTHNSIIIFDWDDTLLPTTFLTAGGNNILENITISDTEKEKISNSEILVSKLLNEAVQKGEVYIITNAGQGWVEYSAEKIYPSIKEVLSKIKIISARNEYEKQFPNDSSRWKIQAFLNIQKNLNIKLVTNIICIGDSLFEMEAGRIMAAQFKEAFIKTVKFREGPKLDELIKQLKLVVNQFDTIYSTAKSLTIRVEKRKKQEK